MIAAKKLALASAIIASVLAGGSAFSPKSSSPVRSSAVPAFTVGRSSLPPPSVPSVREGRPVSGGVTELFAEPPDLEVVALVAGQETYGFAIVAVGEALWSFLQAPSLDHAKVLVPAAVAALVLVLAAGPMVTSGDPSSVTLGLEIATGVSVLLGASYVARLAAPYSPSAKEIAFLGLLVALAGFFSFSQNLVVDGFVTLPSLPSIPMPSLPSINFDGM